MVALAVLTEWLDSMVLKDISNLSDSMILQSLYLCFMPAVCEASQLEHFGRKFKEFCLYLISGLSLGVLQCHLPPLAPRKASQSDKTPKAMKFTQIWVQQWYQDYFSTVSTSQGSLVPAGVYKHNSTSITAALILHLPITSLAMHPAVNSKPQSQEQPYPCKEWNSSGETSAGTFPKQKGKFPSVTADPGLPKLKNILISLLRVPRSPFRSDSRASFSLVSR